MIICLSNVVDDIFDGLKMVPPYVDGLAPDNICPANVVGGIFDGLKMVSPCVGGSAADDYLPVQCRRWHI